MTLLCKRVALVVSLAVSSNLSKAAKKLEQMRANPRDWRIQDLLAVAKAAGIERRQPGGSHVIFRHPSGAMLSVPAARPIKPVYVVRFVRLIEDGIAE